MRMWLKGGVLALVLWAQNALAGTVLVVGDSISAAFGLETEQGWVQLLRERIAETGKEHAVSMPRSAATPALAGFPGSIRCSPSTVRRW